MSSKFKHCICTLSYCNTEKTPARKKIVEKAVSSHSGFKRDDSYIFLWDNGSSDDMKEFLSSCDFYDDIHFSSRNLFDNGAFAALRKKAHDLGCEYITFIEDDCQLFDPDSIVPAIEFLDNNRDCGYLRLLKFETSRIHIYDKFKNHPKKDLGNAQRLFNTVTKEPLRWEKCENISGYQFF